jgi:hypothetical protein
MQCNESRRRNWSYLVFVICSSHKRPSTCYHKFVYAESNGIYRPEFTMPTFAVYTNLQRSSIPDDFVLKASAFIAKQLGKPESVSYPGPHAAVILQVLLDWFSAPRSIAMCLY